MASFADRKQGVDCEPGPDSFFLFAPAGKGKRRWEGLQRGLVPRCVARTALRSCNGRPPTGIMLRRARLRPFRWSCRNGKESFELDCWWVAFALPRFRGTRSLASAESGWHGVDSAGASLLAGARH